MPSPDRLYLNLTVLPFFSLSIDKPLHAMDPGFVVTLEGLAWSGEEVRARASSFAPRDWRASIIESLNPHVGITSRVVQLSLSPSAGQPTTDDVLHVLRSLIAHLVGA